MKQKIKIMKQQPPISDEEIRSYMNFDGLMASRKQALSKPKFQLLKWIIPSIAIIGVGAWLVFSPGQPAQQSNAIPEETAATTTATPAEVVPSPNEQTIALAEKEEKPVANQPADKKSTPVQKENARQADEKKSPEDVYIQAEPIDGYSSLYAYFNSNLVYPSAALKDSIQGVETVSFVINTDGKPEKITVKQSLGEPFEKEARRLIENMPQWKPATLNGKPVPSQMSVPLTFQIQKVNVNR
jgi:protein TonB